MSNSSPLMINDLSCAYHDQPILDNIHLEVKPGEFMAILGPSGCGKSTLLRLISGLASAREGEIHIAGTTVVKNGLNIIPVEKRNVGLVFQDYALFPFQTVRENIGFGIRNNRARVDELLKLIHMSHLADRLPYQLSGGQQQRVALARALAPRPPLLLLDEPFANVDTTLRQQLIRALQQLVAHENTSVILVTHDRNEAFALADRVAILMHGASGSYIVQCATPEIVYQQPANRDVALLAGAAFLLPASAKGEFAHTALGEVRLQNPQMAEGEIVVRPEMASFTPDPVGNATLLQCTFQGCHYHLLCDTPGGQLFTETRSKTPPAVGTKGKVSIIEACWFLATAG
ncbi:MAG TPA: ABC transporter ATP-binding protein [Gammaproteobacteria bacterium]|nr:ABC transporter ATP-binding protein [Gammaproteobacteria bacterium]